MKKNNKHFNLKVKLGTTIMINGKKQTGEKIILQSAKRLQKSTNKSLKNLMHLAIINTTSTFKLNEQVLKKGKRKTTRTSPSFITTNSSRNTISLKLLRNSALKSQKATQFFDKFASEILTSVNSKSQAVDRKNEIQSQIFANKRYLSRFRW